MTSLVQPTNTTDLSVSTGAPATFRTYATIPNAAYGANPIDPASVIANNISALTSITQLSYLDQTPKYYMSMTYGPYNGRINMFQVAAAAPNTTTSIVLPLPQHLLDAQAVSYDHTPLETTGLAADILMNGINSDNQAAHSGQNELGYLGLGVGAGILGAGIGAAIGAIGGNPAAGEKLGAAVAAGGVNSIAKIAGFSPNEFLTILLRGPKYKEFDFQWEFSPKTVSESTKLNTILTNLKNASAPSLALGGALFYFPNIFQLAFVPNPKFMFKFKPAVLTDIVVDYAGGGYPSFLRQLPGSYSNAPAELRVKMHFLELEFWLSGQYNESNDPLATEGGTLVTDTGISNFFNNLVGQISAVPANGPGGKIPGPGDVPGVAGDM